MLSPNSAIWLLSAAKRASVDAPINSKSKIWVNLKARLFNKIDCLRKEIRYPSNQAAPSSKTQNLGELKGS